MRIDNVDLKIGHNLKIFLIWLTLVLIVVIILLILSCLPGPLIAEEGDIKGGFAIFFIMCGGIFLIVLGLYYVFEHRDINGDIRGIYKIIKKSKSRIIWEEYNEGRIKAIHR